MRTNRHLAVLFASALITAHQVGAQNQSDTNKSEHACSIRGVTINKLTGAPVKHVAVRLRAMAQDAQIFSSATLASLSVNSSAVSSYSTVSGVDGSFCLEGVKDGQYALSGTKNGFLDTNYGADSPTESGKSVIMGSQNRDDLTLALLPQGVVSGRVTDEDDEPVGSAFVNVLTRVIVGGDLKVVRVRNSQTNDLGEFRVANVPPGTYYVLVEPKISGALANAGNRKPLRTFSPGVMRLSEATPFSLQAGEERGGINVRVLFGNTFHVRGRVAGLSSTDRGGLTLSPDGEEQLFIGAGAGNLKADGSFDFAGVAPGVYELKYLQVSGEGAKGGKRSVEVTDQDVTDLSLPITHPASIHGRIHIENAPSKDVIPADLRNVRLMLIASDAIVGPKLPATVSEDGAFAVRNIITPGRYTVRVDAPAGTYTKSIRYGQAEVAGRDLEFLDGTSGEMDISLRYGLAKLSGRVDQTQNEQNSAGSGGLAHVVLIPEILDTLQSGMMFTSSDASGAFSLGKVPPARYRAYALESLDFAALHDPAVLKALEASGTEVELGEGDDKSVSLRMIPSNEAHRIANSARNQ